MTPRLTNWAGNVTYTPREVSRPSTLDELRRTVATAPRVKALGSRHSFSRVADTSGTLVCVDGLPPVVELDTARRAVRVAAGLRYGEVATALQAAGHGLHNLGSLPHISVGGAVATGTHGSGDRLRCLAGAVRGLELVTADGDLVTLERGVDADFAGAVVALGALGVVAALTLDVEPTYDVAQHVYDGITLAALRDCSDELFASGDSVSVFTDWGSPWGSQVWRKRRLAPGAGTPPAEPEWLGARLADGPRHPVPGMPPVSCTVQAGEPGPWHARLPHFRMEFTPSSGEELQSEWLLPRSRFREALDAVAGVRDRVGPVLQVSELRIVAADDLWLSPASGRDCVAFHFTWVADGRAVLPVVEVLDDLLVPLGGRPHWGKVTTVDADGLRSLYPRVDDVQRLRRRLDPGGAFRNEALDRWLPVS